MSPERPSPAAEILPLEEGRTVTILRRLIAEAVRRGLIREQEAVEVMRFLDSL